MALTHLEVFQPSDQRFLEPYSAQRRVVQRTVPCNRCSPSEERKKWDTRVQLLTAAHD